MTKEKLYSPKWLREAHGCADVIYVVFEKFRLAVDAEGDVTGEVCYENRFVRSFMCEKAAKLYIALRAGELYNPFVFPVKLDGICDLSDTRSLLEELEE